MYELPESIIKNVNRKNWERVFDNEMIYEGEYVWKPEVMKEFIRKLLNEDTN